MLKFLYPFLFLFSALLLEGRSEREREANTRQQQQLIIEQLPLVFIELQTFALFDNVWNIFG